MTRDQAIEIEMKQLKRYLHGGDIALIATANIDALIELGLLHVEAPRTNRQKFVDELAERGYRQGGAIWAEIVGAYDKVHHD